MALKQDSVQFVVCPKQGSKFYSGIHEYWELVQFRLVPCCRLITHVQAHCKIPWCVRFLPWFQFRYHFDLVFIAMYQVLPLLLRSDNLPPLVSNSPGTVYVRYLYCICQVLGCIILNNFPGPVAQTWSSKMKHASLMQHCISNLQALHKWLQEGCMITALETLTKSRKMTAQRTC